MIYFIQSGDSGPIKIGLCQDGGLRRRIQALQTGNPARCTVLGTMAGDVEREKAIHYDLREHRIRGEWFAPSGPVIRYVSTHAERSVAAEEPEPNCFVSRVIWHLGGPTKAAATLGLKRPSVIMNWRARKQIPADKVLDVEAATGISRHVLRPDIFGPKPERAA